MKRRDFLLASGALVSLLVGGVLSASDANAPARVMTVTGEIPADKLGRMLPHEHVLVDFIGADLVNADRYDTLFTRFLPKLREAGLGDEEIRQLIVTNPGKAFAIGIRQP